LLSEKSNSRFIGHILLSIFPLNGYALSTCPSKHNFTQKNLHNIGGAYCQANGGDLSLGISCFWLGGCRTGVNRFPLTLTLSPERVCHNVILRRQPKNLDFVTYWNY
ncbi:MAG: hypothetical protein WBD64_00520, partial [Candidatus Zixiibacteriota bacterium]